MIILKSEIKGKIKCRTNEDVCRCKDILDSFRIENECNDTVIHVNGHVKASPFFDREGFERMLCARLRKFGMIKLNVSVQK